MFEIDKQRLVQEDMERGAGTVQQERNGLVGTYTRINSKSIPMADDPGKSVDDALQGVIDEDYTYSKGESDERFARISGNSSTPFSVGKATSPFQAVQLEQLDEIEMEIDDISGLPEALDARFLKSEHIDLSEGGAGAGKPIVLNNTGKIDNSLFDTVVITPRGTWTPTGGNEYPTDAVAPLDAWAISGVDSGSGYTFLTGSLIGETVFNGDIIINFGVDEWLKFVFSSDPADYYKLDGSQAIMANFAANSYKLVSVGDGTADTDGINKGQMDAGLAEKASLATLAAHVGNTSNPHAVTKTNVGLPNVDNTSDIQKPVSTATQTALDTKSNTTHTHTKDQVGLGSVDNTADTAKPVSIATQTALDGKPTGSWSWDGSTLAITI